MNISIVAPRAASCEKTWLSGVEFSVFIDDFNIWIPWIKFQHRWPHNRWLDLLNSLSWYLSLFDWRILLTFRFALRCITSVSSSLCSYLLSWHRILSCRHFFVGILFLCCRLLFCCFLWCGYLLRSRFSSRFGLRWCCSLRNRSFRWSRWLGSLS